MKKGYNFPYNNGGIIGGINDSGIETFKGTPIYSLTKETIQNALDARSSKNEKTIRVEFKLHEMERYKFPYLDQYEDILNRCKNYWENDKKTLVFIKNALDLLKKNNISILEVSDYNTTGLKGAKDHGSSPFNNLVKSSGVSNKSDDAGGSFGIGKNAPYTCSAFRTVLYSTLDEDGILAMQGVAKLVTHKQDNRDTQGTGFLGITEKNEFDDVINRPFLDSELRNNINEKFIRNKVGTSLFILGFIRDDTWRENIIKSTIDYYMMAIIENKLEVVVQDIIINKDTIESIIENYFKDETSLTLNYYKSIISKQENTYIFENEDFEGMGEIKLYLYIDENLPKKVAYIRSNGMKIIDKDRFRVTQQFVGVLYFEGKEINKFIRSLENPSHDKIEYKRHERSTYAKEILSKLSGWIRECVKSLETNNNNIIDAEGISEYLPDDINEGITKIEVKERIVKKITKVSLEEVKKPRVNKDKKKDSSGKGKDIFPGRESKDNDNGSKNDGKDTDNTRKDKGRKNNSEKLQIKRSRVFCPSGEGTYRVIIESNEKCNSYFKLRVIGEEGSEIADIKSANLLNGDVLKIENNIVGPIKFNRDEKKVIEVKLEKSIRCAMEVENSVSNI